MVKAAAFAKEQGANYMDLYGRSLVDIAIMLINGYLFCGQASSKVDIQVSVAPDDDNENGQMISMKKRKVMVAHRYITKNAKQITAMAEAIFSGDKSTFEQYGALIGSVPQE